MKEKNSISFIWFDRIVNDCEEYLHQIIQPYQWNFFNRRSDCMAFIENQLRRKHFIILIVSGSFGNDLFLSAASLLHQISSIYIYCAQIDTHSHWAKKYSQIKGIFNQSNKLAQQIEKDFEQIKRSFHLNHSDEQTQSITTNEHQVSDISSRKNRSIVSVIFSQTRFL